MEGSWRLCVSTPVFGYLTCGEKAQDKLPIINWKNKPGILQLFK